MACRISWRPTARGTAAGSGGEPASANRNRAPAVTPSLGTRHGRGAGFGLAVLRDVQLPPVPGALLVPARVQLAVGQSPGEILGIRRSPLGYLLQASQDGALEGVGDGKLRPARGGNGGRVE